MPSTKLFVGNIPYATTEQDLRDLFGRSGAKVTRARVITDFDTGRSKGYAFVEMASPEDAQKAIQDLHNLALAGRNIVVSEARPRPTGGGSGGGGNRRGGRPSA
jgi:RNA recognition motif-containing protein